MAATFVQGYTFGATELVTNTKLHTLITSATVSGIIGSELTDDTVTYAKIQNVSATNKVLGRSTAGAGDIEEIDCTAAGRALLDDADAAAQKTTLSLNNVENTALSSWAGSANITTVGTLSSGNADGVVSASSDTVAGKIECATITETNTGTDAGRAVTPDGLAGSIHGKKIIQVITIDSGTAVTTGDGKAYFFIPSDLNGMNLVDADACVNTVSSSGTPTVMVYNVTDSQDMLSVGVTIDANEKTSYTAATAPTINTSYDDVATGDELRIDVDVAGTGTKGLSVILVFQTP